MKRRDPHQWLKQREKDIYFIKAKKEGYRARSAYKLIEINEKYDLLKGMVLDLGAAPGAWLQVALKFGVQHIDGIDLLPIEPINFVNTLQGDIFSQDVADFLSKKKYNTILCDISPNMSGQRAHDHLAQINVAYKVLELSKENLQNGGNLCIKLFDGAAIKEFFSQVRLSFQRTYRFKPKASNMDSSEFYFVGLGYLAQDKF